MTEIAEVELSGESKITRISLLIVSVLLIFVGPTYFPYLLVTAGLAESIALVLGFVLFVVGLVMLIYLIRKKIIT
ncbi:MAG: hypothetical protein GX799_07290 [Crenarchaeota archaeon]|jgi:hypothetical protein|nr:hypothetical protein [Thermoproteota archaeon]